MGPERTEVQARPTVEGAFDALTDRADAFSGGEMKGHRVRWDGSQPRRASPGSRPPRSQQRSNRVQLGIDEWLGPHVSPAVGRPRFFRNCSARGRWPSAAVP